MKIEELITAMTLEEKASLLSGRGFFTTKGIPRLGIPSMVLADGPHGLRKTAGAGDHLGIEGSLPATCFPTASAMANTWDPALCETLGQHLGREARAQRVSILLGPGLNMKRSPLCGRNFEYFSEDPFLAGKTAAAFIRGIQSQGVAACPKHFAANNQETLRMHIDSVVDERTLREIYLTGFEIAVKEGRPQALMTSYNRINGTYASENSHLLKDILISQWGFRGIVMSDWGGSNDRVAGLEAGSQLEMPGTRGNSDGEIVRAVEEGRLPLSLVDERVKDYLEVLFATVPAEEPPPFDQEAHHGFARQAAGEAIVLLKNENQLLPLKGGTKVAILGELAERFRYQGYGSSTVKPTRLERPLEALKEAGLEVIGCAPGVSRRSVPGQLEAACALAEKADVVLLYLGLEGIDEWEGMDRKDMGLPLAWGDFWEALPKANPNIIVVLCGGAPFETPWLDKCRGAIHGYLGGQAGAGAMAAALTGGINPSGKLAETWPLACEDTPAKRYFPGLEKTTEYREGLFIGYRYYATAGVPVRFPFGFGLSYTTFDYADIKADEKEVSFSLKNTGGREGAEIAQVYIAAKEGKVFRPVRELKGFAKVRLRSGEERRVVIPLDDKAFRYFNVKTRRFEIEGGGYLVQVGASVEDIRLSAEVFVEGTGAPLPYDPKELPSYRAGKVSNVDAGEFETLLGRPLPESRWDRRAPLEVNDTFCQLIYAKGWVGRLVYRSIIRLKTKAEKTGKPNLLILFLFYLPFRGISKLYGSFNREMVEAMVEVFNGRLFRGLCRFLKARSRLRRSARAKEKKLKAGV
ncbi:MAG: beta-glucosidase [Spirochaetales bacterium]|jgi:beta-glucosidase|nr:beta-glucosidase [Spirochaetales bacterium]